MAAAAPCRIDAAKDVAGQRWTSRSLRAVFLAGKSRGSSVFYNSFRRRWRALCLLALLFPLSVVGALAERLQFGPFSVDPAKPDIIQLDGEIDSGSALAFRRALSAAPEAKLVVLNSGGGLVSMGLLIADDVFTRRLATLVPSGSRCFSACAFIFLAGADRQADGELGVHQISSEVPDLTSAQLSISDIIDTLNRFGTPVEVLTTMFRTPSNKMHVFSAAEVAKHGINRRAGDPPPAPAPSSISEIAPPESGPEKPSLPSIDGSAIKTARLSVIEDYARQPNRLALYAGLDFAGQDIGAVAVDDTAQCAKACLQTGSECTAFTFNVRTPKSKGPNCFLKLPGGQPDGNAAAISGHFLSRADPAPSAYTVGVIDPASALYRDVDLSGDDLSRRAHPRVTMAGECRLACVANAECRAFTFVQSRRECWLKSGIGQPRPAPGMISGVKTVTSFSPATVLDLE